MKILPLKLKGQINAIASKSHAHRLLICAALSDKPTKIKISNLNDDIGATIKALTALGTVIDIKKDYITVTPAHPIKSYAFINCQESGSTLRFMVPIVSMICKSSLFIGSGKLPKRPILPLLDVMRKHGAVIENNRLPFKVYGRLTGGIYNISGKVSSQFISGLLFALCMAEDDSQIHILDKLESKAYVDMTISALSEFGIIIKEQPYGYFIKGSQQYKSLAEATVEGDWSNAAPFLAAGALGGPVTVCGLNYNSLQPDKKIADFLKQFGANVTIKDNSVLVSKNKLCATQIDMSQSPDLFPVLSVVAAAAEGTTTFTNCNRLRYKESDRLKSTFDLLNSIGAKAEISDDNMVITGSTNLKGGTVKSYNDHRIVMSAALASTICNGPINISDYMAVNKSYPTFFEHFNKLGGKYNGI